MSELILYSTMGCHLCEQAAKLCEPLVRQAGISLREIDIADDDQLIAAYGVRIPVLQDSRTQLELGWPFDAARVRVWLADVQAHR